MQDDDWDGALRRAGRRKNGPVCGVGIEHDANWPPRRRWRGFRSRGGRGFQEVRMISPQTGRFFAPPQWPAFTPALTCQGTGRCFRSWCARAGAARRADYRYAGKSKSLWPVVASGYRTGEDPGHACDRLWKRAARIISS